MESQHILTLELDPGEASANDLTNLFLALSDLHRACGGQGLALQKQVFDQKRGVFYLEFVPADKNLPDLNGEFCDRLNGAGQFLDVRLIPRLKHRE